MMLTKQDINEIKNAVGEKIDEKIDELAVIVKRGFDETASKQDLAVFRTEVSTRFEGVDKRLEGVDKRLDHLELNTNHMSAAIDTIQQDIAEIKKHFVYRYEFEDLMARVKYLEAKLGVESGK